MKPYFLYDGIVELAQTLTGTENVYLGIRPYAFHAGNMVTMIVYPLLLCREMEKLGKTPEFNFFIFINDWEQDRLAGPNTKTYPFNIFPLNTTFQYATNPDHPAVSIVDYWQSSIVSGISSIQATFPKVKITPIRNSEMKTHPVMKSHVLYTLQHPHEIAEIFRGRTVKEVLNTPLTYALAVCPYCQMAKGLTEVSGADTIIHACSNCGQTTTAPYEHFDYWFYHKPLAIPRLEICDIDLCITGFDHYNEGDYLIRQDLIDLFGSKAKFPKTLYAPLLMGKNGEIMGKSRGNAEIITLSDLIELVVNNQEAKELQPLDGTTTFSMSEIITEEPSSVFEIKAF